MLESLCLCCSGESYKDCCGPLLSGKRFAETPQQLMRSRYSAYHRGEVDYLIETLHPDFRKPDDRKSIEENSRNTQWLGLRVIEDMVEGECGIVEFCAFFQSEGVQQLHERSNFVKNAGRWRYTDGEILPPIKLSRNDPCICGSGKKYKRCHG